MSIIVACFTKRNQKERAAKERERKEKSMPSFPLLAVFLAIAFSVSSASSFLTV
jgi:hypothetical protein